MEREQKKFYKKNDFLLYFFFNNVTLIKTSHPALCRQIKFVLNLKVVHKRRSLIDPFPANHCLAFSSQSLPASSALYSDDSSWQVSDKKLQRQ